MQKTKLAEHFRPLSHETVKYTEMGNVLEVQFMTCRNTKISIQKLDKDHYMELATGEVHEFEHNTSRASDMNNVRVSLRMLRNYINANVQDVTHCRWITLTYKENMKDPTRLYDDGKKFNKRMRYHLKKSFGVCYEYIVAAEPQARGAWHLHMLMIFPEKAPFIPNEELRNIWGHGFVKIGKLTNVDNVGAYLTAYLADMELSEATENYIEFKNFDVKEAMVTDEDGIQKTKRFVKGARLTMYPPGFHLYRTSRGIKQPTVSYLSAGQAMEKVGAATPTFEHTVELTDEATGFHTVINKRYFNRLREKMQEDDGNEFANGVSRVPDNPAIEREQPENDCILQPLHMSFTGAFGDGYLVVELDPASPAELCPAPTPAQHNRQ